MRLTGKIHHPEPEPTWDEIAEHVLARDWDWFRRNKVDITHPVWWTGIVQMEARIRVLEEEVKRR